MSPPHATSASTDGSGALGAGEQGARWVIELFEPLQGVAPGQTAVLYQSTRVLGQATIDSAVNSARLATPLHS